MSANARTLAARVSSAWRAFRAGDDELDRLREREARLQSVLATVPDAMIIIDEAGTMQSFSAAAERLFGWTEAEAVGRNVSLLMPGPYRDEHDGYLDRYLATNDPHIIGIGRVVVGERRDGSTFPIHLSVGEGRIDDRRFFVGFIRDLTERERSAARVQDLQSELAHVSRLTAMGEIASALAHELNQPLSAVTNYLRGSRRLVEKDDPADRARLAEALGKAGEAALRAGDVIRRLRDFMARSDPERRIESVAKLIEDASALALVGTRDMRVRARMRFDRDADAVLADRVQIQQVAVNLMRNAVDAMEATERRELQVTSRALDGDFTVVTVSDTGPGFEEEVRARLFEPFMTTKKTGMGVGLSICRTIVEAHGGTIWAETNADGGASFSFTLPRAGSGEETSVSLEGAARP